MQQQHAALQRIRAGLFCRNEHHSPSSTLENVRRSPHSLYPNTINACVLRCQCILLTCRVVRCTPKRCAAATIWCCVSCVANAIQPDNGHDKRINDFQIERAHNGWLAARQTALYRAQWTYAMPHRVYRAPSLPLSLFARLFLHPVHQAINV